MGTIDISKNKNSDYLAIIEWCVDTFGTPTNNTWMLKNLSSIHFTNQKYQTMFILRWGSLL